MKRQLLALVFATSSPAAVRSFSFLASNSLAAYDLQYQQLVKGQQPSEQTQHAPLQTENESHDEVTERLSFHNQQYENGAAESHPNSNIHGKENSPTISGIEGELIGEVIGNEGKYELTTDYKESTSGKSAIYKAFRHDSDGNPTDEPVVVKLSSNRDQLKRETENFQTITKDGNGEASELFVKIHDYMEDARINPTESENISDGLEGSSAIVMEQGTQDLRSYLKENGPMEGEQLRNVAKTTARAIGAVHDSHMVWSDIKPENFVVQDDGDSVKGIDLESAVKQNENPIDFTPEACPPEFALEYLCGREAQMKMDKKFDVWSLGMLLYELATGEHYFENKDEFQITQSLRMFDKAKLDNARIQPELKALISDCLQVNPDDRPTISQVLAHQYFT